MGIKDIYKIINIANIKNCIILTVNECNFGNVLNVVSLLFSLLDRSHLVLYF